MSSEANYLRLVTLVMNQGADSLRQLLRRCRQRQGCADLTSWLAQHKNDIERIAKNWKCPSFNATQMKILFPPNGQVEEATLDVSVTRSLIEKYGKCSRAEKALVDKFVKVRNQLLHLGQAAVDDERFEALWTEATGLIGKLGRDNEAAADAADADYDFEALKRAPLDQELAKKLDEAVKSQEEEENRVLEKLQEVEDEARARDEEMLQRLKRIEEKLPPSSSSSGEILSVIFPYCHCPALILLYCLQKEFSVIM